MKVEQITVFIENRSGRLADVATLLADAGVNIRATALADAADFGILRLIVNDTEKANQVLKAHGFAVSKTHVVAVAVPDRSGGLAEIIFRPTIPTACSPCPCARWCASTPRPACPWSWATPATTSRPGRT